MMMMISSGMCGRQEAGQRLNEILVCAPLFLGADQSRPATLPLRPASARPARSDTLTANLLLELKSALSALQGGHPTITTTQAAWQVNGMRFSINLG
jgi:hypothetical protein